MTNPINPLNRATTSNINSNAEQAATRTKVDSKASSSTSSADTVSLSQASQQVSDLQLRLKNTPEVDSAKVEAIKQEIANGNYPLDPEKIAENLVALEQSLIE